MLPATIALFHSFPSLSICHHWSAFGQLQAADVATAPPSSYTSTFFFRQRNCIRMHLQSSVTERCKPLRLLVEGSTVSPLKALQSCVCVYIYMCTHSCMCTLCTLQHTFLHLKHIHTHTHTITEYKQNHLCVVWLGIAVAELCWAQPGHCWGLGCPVSTEKERERENTHRHPHPHTHSEPVCLHLVFSQSPGSSWPEYLSAFNELKSFGC